MMLSILCPAFPGFPCIICNPHNKPHEVGSTTVLETQT